MTLAAGMTFGDAAAILIATRTEAVFEERGDVLDVTDIEVVHKMRVATRRLRAALEVFGPCLRPKRRRRTLRDVKSLAAALGERRDRDVQLERLARLHAETAGAERHAVDLLAEELRREQARANDDLATALGRATRSRLHERLARLTR